MSDRCPLATVFWVSLVMASLFAPHSLQQFPGPGMAFADDHDDGGRDADDDDDDDDDDTLPARTPARPPGPNAAPGGGEAQGDLIPSHPATAAPPLPAFRPEIVVLGLSDQDLAALEVLGFTRIARAVLQGSLIDISRLTPPDGLDLIAARDLVRARPSGADADLNHFYRGDQATDAGEAAPCLHGNCRAHQLINWPSASQRASACADLPLIGLLDTGINEAHDLLARATIKTLPMPTPRADPSKRVHGTAVLSVLAGDPGSRVEGVLPEAPLAIADVFERAGKDERTDIETLLRGLDLLAAEEVRVINLSLSGPQNSVLAEMVKWLVADQGIVVVASVGNGGPRAAASYPAGLAEVVAVTAVDQRLRSYDLAQRGDHVDLAAPGVGLLLATSVSGARDKSGTSFAAPFVTAAAALMLAREPGLAPADVAARLTALSTDIGESGRDPVFGAGLLNVKGLCG